MSSPESRFAIPDAKASPHPSTEEGEAPLDFYDLANIQGEPPGVRLVAQTIDLSEAEQKSPYDEFERQMQGHPDVQTQTQRGNSVSITRKARQALVIVAENAEDLFGDHKKLIATGVSIAGLAGGAVLFGHRNRSEKKP
ncbi:MAG TPA: hypothetical protein VG935_02650 [Patescibacteria group bacterium]|nr:hypothetical protein [Patescibacteria group bacterium]